MTRTELGQLYKAKGEVERARHVLGEKLSFGPGDMAKAYLSDALWTMKQLIDTAVIEHEAQNHQTSLDEQAAQGERDGKRSV